MAGAMELSGPGLCAAGGGARGGGVSSTEFWLALVVTDRLPEQPEASPDNTAEEQRLRQRLMTNAQGPLQGLFCHSCSGTSLSTIVTGPGQQCCPNCGSEFVEARSVSAPTQAPLVLPCRAAGGVGRARSERPRLALHRPPRPALPAQGHPQLPGMLGETAVVSRVQVLVPGASPGQWQEVASYHPG